MLIECNGGNNLSTVRKQVTASNVKGMIDQQEGKYVDFTTSIEKKKLSKGEEGNNLMM